MTQDPTDKSVDETASTLNELIQTCTDGETGFRAAAESVEDSNLRRLFESYVQQRHIERPSIRTCRATFE